MNISTTIVPPGGGGREGGGEEEKEEEKEAGKFIEVVAMTMVVRQRKKREVKGNKIMK